MTRKLVVSCVILALCAPALVVASSHEEAASPSFAYGTYFECDVAREWLADAIVEQLIKPVYDQAVEEGIISGWGYLNHHTGGKWRRVIYRVSPTLEGALSSTGVLASRAAEANAQAFNEFGAICPAHEDYIWQVVVGSSGTSLELDRGTVGFSVYFHCNEATENDADEVAKTVFAPVYDAQVAAGNLTDWSYMQHWVGGEYRRLLTMTATDVGKLMAGRDGAVTALLENEAVGPFFDSCTSHSDYIWNIVHETP